MSINTFSDETLIIKKAEALLQKGSVEQGYQAAYEKLLTDYEELLVNYTKLVKVSSRIVRIGDRNEKSLITARDQIQAQQIALEEAHQELKRMSEHRLRSIIEATPIAIIISRVDDGEIIYTNEIAGPMLGLETEQLLNRKRTDFYLHPTEKEKLANILQRDGQVDHFELQIKKNDGSILWGDISERYITFNKELCILCACNDITHLKELSQAASRFVPVEYLSFLKKESIVDIKLGDHISDRMTMMFSDLRSFTTMAEGMTPQQHFDFINAYLGRISPVIQKFNGLIVKYLGDGIMAIFPDSADDGVQACIEQLNQVNLYNTRRAKAGRPPIQVGIGVNTGYMMLGMVGEENRMQGDAFSDDINLTSRLEGLTKFYDVSLIISAATRNALKDPLKYNIRYLDKVQVKGKTKAIDLYEVFDSDLPELRSQKQETLEMYEKAMKLYFAKDFSAAQSLLFKVLQKNPNDKVAWYHLTKVTQFKESGVEENWMGVTAMTSK